MVGAAPSHVTYSDDDKARSIQPRCGPAQELSVDDDEAISDDELLESDGEYARLYAAQFAGAN